MPAINLNFAQRSIDRKSGNEEAINAGPKSQRPKRAMPARRPATKQRQLDMTSAIAQSEQSANDRPVYQVFAQRSVPAKSTIVRIAQLVAIRAPQRCAIPKIANTMKIRYANPTARSTKRFGPKPAYAPARIIELPGPVIDSKSRYGSCPFKIISG